MCRALCLIALVIIVFCLIPPVSAQQSATASLSGRVNDPAGAVIVGAQVVIEQSAVGFRREITTNNEGIYVFTSLPAGEYVLTIKAAHFPRSLKRSIMLRVGQSATFDGTLEVSGPTEEIIQISSDSATSVNTTSAVVEGVVTSRAVQNLPLNGRNYLELALLIPGNTLTPNFTPAKSNFVVISSAGQFGRGGNVMIDGADNNDDASGGPLQNISQDAVQEFQIATNRFSAEQGRTGSSVINVVTKSGTNELHGSAALYWRDRRLQGLPATVDRNSQPPFDREQFSATLGGPIKRDRAWWFGSFEYRNQDGALLVGERDTATRTIKRVFAPSPVNDALGTGRFDWRPSSNNSLNLRYSIQREDDVSAANLQRAIGSASQRQASENHIDSVSSNYTRVISPTAVNSLTFSFSRYVDTINQVTPGPQLTFPSIQDGGPWRADYQIRQKRLQFVDTLSLTRGRHALKLGGEIHRIDGGYNLGVFRRGRIEVAEDFAGADRNKDGRIDDNDLLFSQTTRKKDTENYLAQPDIDNTHVAAFIQDDWRVTPQLTLNLGLRYQIDTEEKLVSRYDEVNPIVLPFLKGERKRDKNNFAPRFGFNWATKDARTSIHGGYGIYYDKIILQITSLERALDGRSLAVVVRAGNAAINSMTGQPLFLDQNGKFLPGAPTIADPFTGPITLGEGASGINIIDNGMENPMVQQFNIGIQREIVPGLIARADYIHNLGTHFLIGRNLGSVFNPVIGGPERVVNLESSVKTKYDGLLVSVEKRFSYRFQFRTSYTLSKSFNYANDDQIPFSIGPVDHNNLQLEYGPLPNDQRHRFVFAGDYELPRGFGLAAIWTMASGVPMDIIMPDGRSRVPLLQRNAGGRVIHTGAELNAFIRQANSAGGINYMGRMTLLPFVRDDARFSDGFNSFDLRLSKAFVLRERVRLEPMAEVFNLFNVTNILGVSNVNYSGFASVLTRDSNIATDPGFLRSSAFGTPVTTAGGVFGSGGPRAFQFAVKVSF
jgi:outer membrane receptor protein involved in Fe transport